MATPSEAVSQLIQTMTGNSTVHLDIKVAAAEGLGYAGGKDARQALIDIVTANSTVHLDIKVAAAKALGHASKIS
jgi:HEAT repeat protein